MSYEPTIVINRKSFEPLSKKLENDWEWPESEEKVMAYLKEVWKGHTVVAISGVEMFLCSPELTSFNNAVREMLDEWGVEYGVDY